MAGRRFVIPILVLLMLFQGCDRGSQIKETPQRDQKIIEKVSILHQEGLGFFNDGKYNEAVKVWTEEAELDPENPNTWNNIGIAYKYNRECDKAIPFHQKAIKLDANFGHAYFSFGKAYLCLGMTDEAKATFLKAAGLGYEPHNSYSELGNIYFKKGSFAEAKEAYQKSVSFKPSFEAYRMLGITNKKTGEIDDAINAFTRALEQNPPAGLEREIDREIFEFEYEKALSEKAPEKGEKLFNIALKYWKKGYSTAAFDAFSEVARTDPEFPEVHYWLGVLHRSLDREEEAKKELRKALVLDPESWKAAEALHSIEGERFEKVDRAEISKKGSPLAGIALPQKAIVAFDSITTYDTDLFPQGSLKKGDEVTVVSFHDYRLASSYFFALEGGKGFVSLRDIILESSIKNPWKVSPKGRFQIIRTPPNSLWVKWGKNNLAYLSDLNEYGSIQIQAKDCFITIDSPASWSADERYMFLEGSARVIMPDNTILSFGDGIYTSGVWYDGRLFVRGIGKDDAVYVFDPNTRILSKFLEVSGEPEEYNTLCLNTWLGVKSSEGRMSVTFMRIDTNKEYLKAGYEIWDAGCLILEITMDSEGNIISKNKSFTTCINDY